MLQMYLNVPQCASHYVTRLQPTLRLTGDSFPPRLLPALQCLSILLYSADYSVESTRLHRHVTEFRQQCCNCNYPQDQVDQTPCQNAQRSNQTSCLPIYQPQTRIWQTFYKQPLVVPYTMFFCEKHFSKNFLTKNSFSSPSKTGHFLIGQTIGLSDFSILVFTSTLPFDSRLLFGKRCLPNNIVQKFAKLAQEDVVVSTEPTRKHSFDLPREWLL